MSKGVNGGLIIYVERGLERCRVVGSPSLLYICYNSISNDIFARLVYML